MRDENAKPEANVPGKKPAPLRKRMLCGPGACGGRREP